MELSFARLAETWQEDHLALQLRDKTGVRGVKVFATAHAAFLMVAQEAHATAVDEAVSAIAERRVGQITHRDVYQDGSSPRNYRMAHLKTAKDARNLIRTAPALQICPSVFAGTLEEFADRHVLPNLPTGEVVIDFHQALMSYVAESDALFLVRAVSGTERRHDYPIAGSVTFRATDNAPSWWVHSALTAGHRIAPGAMRAIIGSMPCHMFDVSKVSAPVAASVGWHIAHIFNVKDGDTDYSRWTRRDVVARFIRNIHPANHFLFPKHDWQRGGSDPRVVGYFASLYERRYGAVWDEFVAKAGASSGLQSREGAPIRLSFGDGKPSISESAPVLLCETGVNLPDTGPRTPAVVYYSSRLTFRREIIEALGDGESFMVNTPDGNFQMTKEQMREVFPGVAASRSYQQLGTYNYSSIPIKAEQFRVKGE